ncbi:MAG TPA: SpoIIE family protein phosphatase, partial [Anaeromyxobacteraceae bacterium]|nr:SpoIIE family protein phosphatase [Anaeromyxobacteraceae bacterium]
MATLEITFLQGQLEERKRRLELAIALGPPNGGLATLLREVDSALQRMDEGTYGICEECHCSIEQDRLLTDPLMCYCLDHLTQTQRAALQRDLDLAAEVQRNLLPKPNLRAGNWETGYHYAPHGPVSGDYCDLIPFDGQLFFVLGDVSGKGVAASMLMTQLHALFRSLTGLGLPLSQIIRQANRVLCESALAGQYATLVCGLASADGEVEIHNAGHLPVILVRGGGAQQIESMGFPLGMFLEGEFPACRHKLAAGDTLFLYSDGLSEARGAGDEYGVERIARFVQEQRGRHAPD